MENKTVNYKLTIVVPVYNEEDNVLRLEKALCDFMKRSSANSCVLFVNDGSTDGGGGWFERFAAVRMISFS